jgi:predicted amidohydrolase YtcJ
MLLLYNARVYPLDLSHQRATAVAIDQGRVLGVGDTDELLFRYTGSHKPRPDATLLDMHGLTILPGLTDAHLHLLQYALSLQKIDCETDSKALCLQRVAERATRTSSRQWILGHGWNQNSWAEGWGTVGELDRITADHPVYLTAKSLHAGWANSAALKLAGISQNTPDPAGGRIGRDEHGLPDGLLFESAMDLISSVIPEPSPAQVEMALEQAQANLWRLGLTGVHDFDQRACFMGLQSMHHAGRLKLRVLKSLPFEDLPYAAGLGLSSGFGDDMLRIGSVKAFADGALGPRTAAMLQPYEGEPHNRGMLLLDGEELYERGRAAIECGLSLAVHAIGDLANHEVLNAFEQLRSYEKILAENGRLLRKDMLRHRIEHVQVIHADDATRLAALGVIASMQPIHATSDMFMADRFWGKRAGLAYALRTQLQAGAILAFGSDAPVESPNPFWGLHAAVTRRRADGSPGPDGWRPEQRLSLEEALFGYTGGAAFAAGRENHLGKLAPGYLADLTILDEDIYSTDPDLIKDLLPVGTMVGGEWVLREFG